MAAETPAGLPLAWRWAGRTPASSVPVALESGQTSISETLRFDADGRAELRLAPGVYRWRAVGGPERGMVAVERYSDEWRPAHASIAAQAGGPGGSRRDVAARDQWWLFALAMAAFVGEWAWRRRQGLP